MNNNEYHAGYEPQAGSSQPKSEKTQGEEMENCEYWSGYPTTTSILTSYK